MTGVGDAAELSRAVSYLLREMDRMQARLAIVEGERDSAHARESKAILEHDQLRELQQNLELSQQWLERRVEQLERRVFVPVATRQVYEIKDRWGADASFCKAVDFYPTVPERNRIWEQGVRLTATDGASAGVDLRLLQLCGEFPAAPPGNDSPGELVPDTVLSELGGGLGWALDLQSALKEHHYYRKEFVIERLSNAFTARHEHVRLSGIPACPMEIILTGVSDYPIHAPMLSRYGTGRRVKPVPLRIENGGDRWVVRFREEVPRIGEMYEISWQNLEAEELVRAEADSVGG